MRLGLIGFEDRRTHSTILYALVSVALATVAGVLISVKPVLGLALVGVLGVVALLSLGRRLPRVFLGLQFTALLGYAFFSRGFAHFGHNPVYISEVSLLVGLLSLMVLLSKMRVGKIHILLFLFMGWGLLRTLPYWPVYHFDAIRDAALWYYGLFALIFSVILDKKFLLLVIKWYQRFIPYFLFWAPVALVLGEAFASHMPRSLDGETSFLVYNPGDYLVTLGGIAAFELTGIASVTGVGSWLKSTLFWPLWMINALMAGALTRGGLVAASVAAGLAYVLHPTKRIMSAVLIGGVLLCLLLIVNPTIKVPGAARTISVGSLARSVTSIVDSSSSRTDVGALQSNKTWRLVWWQGIINNTIHGQYFWSGQGFGINLATAYGVGGPDTLLRSPHNVNMTVLARMGVPGLALWAALILSIGGMFTRNIVLARRHNQPFWAGVQVWLLAYWLAAFIDGSFDVFIEGPQGGILFWTIIGFGLAASRLQAAEYASKRDERESEPVRATPPLPTERVAA